MYVVMCCFYCAFVPLCSTTVYYITPLLTSPVWVLSMDKSRMLYYKYKCRIYCGGGQNKVTLIRTLCTLPSPSPPLPPLTAASAYRCLCLPLPLLTAASAYRCLCLPLPPLTAASAYRCLRLQLPPLCLRLLLPPPPSPHFSVDIPIKYLPIENNLYNMSILGTQTGLVNSGVM
jgi:hypothetical protein